ncbi:MAG: FAD:protein FMN transferase [Planctomycetaceae bacterium]|jgi:thiamine biosynthesis lipoprotein|nr:FAD:protein FMN transferase [Planctomycetaceae bacterium]
MEAKVYRQARGKAALLFLVACLSACRPDAEPARVSETRRLMGVPWTITLHAASRTAGQAALAAAFAEVARLEAILSDYDPRSELSRLSAAAPTADPVPVSADLWQVLARSVALRDASNGAFDPTVGPLTTLWRQARRSGRLPRPEKLAAARAAVGPHALRLADRGEAVQLPQAGTRLDLGGIGMGYAADRVLALLRDRGIVAALVDASGDIAVSGPPPGATGWRIAVRGLPGQAAAGPTLLLANAAVTTSGDAFQGVEIDGVRYSHIVDPRTGLGVTGPAAVTVIAPDGTTADALATAASVLGPAEGAGLIARFPGCAARFVRLADGRVHESTTASWAAHLAGAASRDDRL